MPTPSDFTHYERKLDTHAQIARECERVGLLHSTKRDAMRLCREGRFELAFRTLDEAELVACESHEYELLRRYRRTMRKREAEAIIAALPSDA